MGAAVPLSVVILAKNESARLAECIRSVSWADEVLVVDDESTDGTASLAKTLGARVVSRAMDLEGRHRNWAHAQAKHDWILSLDADERVTPELADEIGTLLSAVPAGEVFAIPRRNFVGERWVRYGGWYPSPQIKLFKRTVFRWEETTVHPRAISDRPSVLLRGDILHYSYRDLHDFVEKMNRQTSLEAAKWMADRRTMTVGKALWRSLDRFLRALIGKRGFRDGMLGYVLAVMAGMYQFVSFAKYWELQQQAHQSASGPGR
ncbi:MAG TPA: glycosyltransferase family 2 protein [bacterium]